MLYIIKAVNFMKKEKKDAMGVCPPFYLLDENGNIINPVKHINDHVPYSPEKTCGRCHDYKKITKAYHFMQGKGEKLSKEFKEMYPWCTSPGQYGEGGEVLDRFSRSWRKRRITPL